MTADRPEGPPPPSTSPGDRPAATPAQRGRFVAALAVFGLWVAFLAVLASRARPPEAGPGSARPAATDPDAGPR